MDHAEGEGDLKERLKLVEPDPVSHGELFDIFVASTKRIYVKRKDVFTRPCLTISEEELNSKIEEKIVWGGS